MELPVHSLAFVEELYAVFLEDPEAVDPEWRAYFEAWADEQHRMSNGDPVQLGPSFLPRSIFSPSSGGQGTAAAARAEAPMSPLNDFVRGEPSGDAAAVGLPSYTPGDADARRRFLRTLGLFQEAPDEDILAVEAIAEDRSADAGEVIVKEGEHANDLFIVTSGRVEVRRQGRVFARLGVGEVLGEMSLFDAQPRSADVVATERVDLIFLSGAKMVALVESHPQLARSLLRVMTRRLREASARQDQVDQLIRAYRVRGHLLANLDPLGVSGDTNAELDPSYYGFTERDLDLVFSSTTIPGARSMTLREILTHLRNTYCRSIGVQFMHIDDLRAKSWLQDRMESTQNTKRLSSSEQVRILTKLTDAEIFEQFIHKKFIGAKRFSLEGAESLIPLLDLAVEYAGERGVREIVIGMAHRGRLNVLANVMGKSPRQIFREFDDNDPGAKMGRGDVKYHLGYSNDYETTSGNKVHLSLSFNPSHLEFVNPVALGRVRAKQDRYRDIRREHGLGILIHGDASFSGQGVVQETLNMSALAGYETGGTLHIIVNNQIGFTTPPPEGRSTQYATDVAKMLQVPILHVNGEDPEAVAHAVHLALEFRETFHQDVVVDMYCYRRHGHNEGDEPAFTQPTLYKAIRARKTVREGYLDNLYLLGNVTPEQADQIGVERRERLETELGAARAEAKPTADLSYGQGVWKGYLGGRDTDAPEPSTAVPLGNLQTLLTELSQVPDGFHPHPKFGRILSQRREMAEGARDLDWSAGEALAFATLLKEGAKVRLTGQDSERGTFSHRHAVLHDSETGKKLNVFNQLGGAPMEVFNSPLSETGVLGFEYGYSLDFPEALVAWEAQFGDFMNSAQVIIDQFITSGEDKWNRLSGLVMLLPHGFEGQGPEHSSARLERFLMAAADDNIQVCNLTTPAQIFHALRRQVVRAYRKPLVIMSPKSLLRHPRAVSPLSAFSDGGFQRIIPDPQVPSDARRVLLCTGKVFYDLHAHRDENEHQDIAILRLEQIYPLADDTLASALEPYGSDVEVMWVQEEPRNMGAWSHLFTRFGPRILDRNPFRVVSRPPSASPATGSAAAHKIEQARLLEEAFTG